MDFSGTPFVNDTTKNRHSTGRKEDGRTQLSGTKMRFVKEEEISIGCVEPTSTGWRLLSDWSKTQIDPGVLVSTTSYGNDDTSLSKGLLLSRLPFSHFLRTTFSEFRI